MNNLMVLVYLAALGVSLVLRKQSTTHRRELKAEYDRLGIPMPASRPKIPMLESGLTIAMGLLLTIGGGFFLLTLASVPVPAIRSDPGLWSGSGVMIAAGLTLTVLGGEALRQNVRLRKSGSGPAQ